MCVSGVVSLGELELLPSAWLSWGAVMGTLLSLLATETYGKKKVRKKKADNQFETGFNSQSA